MYTTRLTASPAATASKQNGWHFANKIFKGILLARKFRYFAEVCSSGPISKMPHSQPNWCMLDKREWQAKTSVILWSEAGEATAGLLLEQLLIFLTNIIHPGHWWHHMVSYILGNIHWGNGMLPDYTKALPEPVLTYHQWEHSAFTHLRAIS